MATIKVPKYQYIIISVDENRKQITNELLNTVNKTNAYVYNLKGITPENHNKFLDNTDNILSIKDKKKICCAKSHFNAIEYALNENSPEYSIILEDDITFLKENFCELVEEIIQKIDIDSKYDNVILMQIGWIPGNNYPIYKTKHIPFDSINKFNNNLLILNTFYAFGLQGYIVRKSKVQNSNSFKELLEAKNYFDCYNLLCKYDWFNKKSKLFVSDYTINWILHTNVVFPPLIIERNESLTSVNDNMEYWNKYFKDYENEKEKYLL